MLDEAAGALGETHIPTYNTLECILKIRNADATALKMLIEKLDLQLLFIVT